MTNNIEYTEYTSGLIDRKGTFYPCHDEGHHWLNGKLADKGLLPDDYQSHKKEGWLVLTTSYMTECEFTFNETYKHKELTKAQWKAVGLYKRGREEEFFNFNYGWYHVSQLEELRTADSYYDVPQLSCGRSGNKANQLAFLEYKGINVPYFKTVKYTWIVEHMVERVRKKYDIYFEDFDKIAIRSSSRNSLPGIFKTCLNVTSNTLEKYTRVVHNSFSKANDKDTLGVKIEREHFILQEMVDYTKGGSAVIHTDKKQIYGIYHLKKSGETLVGNTVNGFNIESLKVSNKQLYTLIKKVVMDVRALYAMEQEIEIAWDDKEVYVLQTRDLHYPSPVYDNMPCNHNEMFVLDKCLLPGGQSGKLSNTPIEENYILVLETLEVEQIDYLKYCKGIITKKGSKYSHAANIARKFNIPYALYSGDLSVSLVSQAYLKDDILYTY